MNLIDGSRKPIFPNVTSIKEALLGDTSIVQTEDGGLIIAYDEDYGEIDITLFDNPYEKFIPDDSGTLQRAVAKFLNLYFEHYR